MDEPDHTRLRAKVDAAFHRRNIQTLEPRVREIADRMAAAMGIDTGTDGYGVGALWSVALSSLVLAGFAAENEDVVAALGQRAQAQDLKGDCAEVVLPKQRHHLVALVGKAGERPQCAEGPKDVRCSIDGEEALHRYLAGGGAGYQAQIERVGQEAAAVERLLPPVEDERIAGVVEITAEAVGRAMLDVECQASLPQNPPGVDGIADDERGCHGA